MWAGVEVLRKFEGLLLPVAVYPEGRSRIVCKYKVDGEVPYPQIHPKCKLQSQLRTFENRVEAATSDALSLDQTNSA